MWNSAAYSHTNTLSQQFQLFLRCLDLQSLGCWEIISINNTQENLVLSRSTMDNTFPLRPDNNIPNKNFEVKIQEKQNL